MNDLKAFLCLLDVLHVNRLRRRSTDQRAGHFPIILRKLESFNYGGGGGYLAVSFRFFRCSMS